MTGKTERREGGREEAIRDRDEGEGVINRYKEEQHTD